MPRQESRSPSVLWIVSDSEARARRLAARLAPDGSARIFSSPWLALAELAIATPELVIVDGPLPWMTVETFGAALRRLRPGLAVVPVETPRPRAGPSIEAVSRSTG